MSLFTLTPKFKPSRECLRLHTLAMYAARRYFPRVELVTDLGGVLIADRMRWPYDAITLELESIDPKLRPVWAVGKMVAQLAQREPYLHIDNDFVFHSPMPPELRQCRVVVQSKDEPNFYFSGLSQEYLRAAQLNPYGVAYNTGIIGGADLDLLHGYCRFSLDSVNHIVAADWGTEGINGTVASIIGEQSAFGDYLRARGVAPYELIPLPLSSVADDFSACRFTHLYAWTKDEPKWVARVHARLLQDYPQVAADFEENYDRISATLAIRERPDAYRYGYQPYQYQ